MYATFIYGLYLIAPFLGGVFTCTPPIVKIYMLYVYLA